jgi:hypothetical protein
LKALKFQSADVVFDGGIGGACPANHMFFLNTDYIYLRPHSKRQYVPLAPDRFSTNQDAMVKLIGWAGNMTLSGAQFQGVLIALNGYGGFGPLPTPQRLNGAVAPERYGNVQDSSKCRTRRSNVQPRFG